MTIKLSARKLKITTILDPAQFAALGVIPDGASSRTTLSVTIGARTVTAEIATKSIRKAVKTITDNGPDKVVVLLQGSLAASDYIEEAGLVAQVKTAKEPTKSEATV